MILKPEPEWWTGRLDDPINEETYRWHQKVRLWDYNKRPDPGPKLTLTGYASDLGTKRNQGRPGAHLGPAAIRRALGNLTWHAERIIFDTGDLIIDNSTINQLQKELAERIKYLHENNSLSIVLGGSHDLSYGHFKGIYDHLKRQKSKPRLGVINFDAHLDLRSYHKGAHSGTSFLQIADLLEKDEQKFHYLCIGVQRWSNTRHLYHIAKEKNVKIIETHQCNLVNLRSVEKMIKQFKSELDHLLLSIDIDVFDGIYAPGVSAPATMGLVPEFLIHLLPILFEDQKIAGIDIAELNPAYDTDHRTARLAAVLIHHLVQFIKC